MKTPTINLALFAGALVLLISHVKCTKYRRVRRRDIQEIPDDIPTQTTEISLNQCGIRAIRTNAFSHLSNCVNITLYQNWISEIEPGAFNGLINLRRLSIAWNYLTKLNAEMFTGLPSLEKLDVGENTISDIENGTFRYLTNLKTLFLDSNRLAVLTPGMFARLDQLDLLRLSFNLVTDIKPNAFQGLTNLKRLAISHNELTELRRDMFAGLYNLEELQFHNNSLTTIDSSVLSELQRPLQLGVGLYWKNLPPIQCDSRICWLKKEEEAGTITWYMEGVFIHRPVCADGIDWNSWHCSVPECDPAPNVAHAIKLGGSHVENSTITYMCDSCSQGGGAIQCQSSGEWTSTPTCAAVECSDPGSLNNGVRTLSTGAITCGTNVTYTCNDGYELQGNSTLLCGTDGQFDATVPTCVKMVCDSPPDIPHSKRHGFSAAEDSVVTYTCYSCYQGGGSMRCQADGQWTQTPTCTAIECPDAGDLENGVKNPPTGPITCGTHVTYTCNDGYKFLGAKVLLCGPDGHYNASEPMCAARCGIPPSVPNSSVTEDSFFWEGNEVNYTCDDCYEGGGAIQCQSDGQWTEAPTCTAIECPDTGGLENGIKNPPAGPITCGTHVTYTCNHGYELHGNNTLRCESDTQYNGSVPTCDAKILESTLSPDTATTTNAAPNGERGKETLIVTLVLLVFWW